MTRATANEMLEIMRQTHAEMVAHLDPSSLAYFTLKRLADEFAEGVKKLEVYFEQTWGAE